MQDATALVYKALFADETLLTLLGGKTDTINRIYNSPVAPNADEYPRLTMFEVINDDANSADDEPQDSDVNIRIDYWTKDVSTIFSVCKQIKTTLKVAFNTVSVRLEGTLYEEDIQVYHKPINIFLLLEQEV
jgi:hypothetical protein